MMLLAAVLMWALHQWLPFGRLVTAPWNYLGVLPVVMGRVITVAAGTRFRRAQTTFDPFKPGDTSSLVTDGVFGFSRNPMYLGLVLLLIGWAVWLGTVSPWFVVPVFVVVMSVTRIAPEERALAGVFGEGYAAYCGRVRRWVGRR
jgi:protein-S-isoprenylcysteine O-methyltransferase Ste14